MDVVDSAADVTEEDVVEAQGEEETIPVRAANSPETPSTKAFEEHREKGHIPHRDWCKFCIEVRALRYPCGRARLLLHFSWWRPMYT